MATRETLCKYPTVDKIGAYFIDRDGSLFGYILNFLRSSRLLVPEGFAQLEQLSVEAEFFQIEPLTDAVNSLLKKKTAASTQQEKGGCTLEIIEICKGRATNKSEPTRYFYDATRICGRRSVIMSLPRDICSVPASLHGGAYMHDLDSFVEIQQGGSNVRLRLAEYLHGEGW